MNILSALSISEFPETADLRKNQDLYNGYRLVVEGTTFLIFERKNGNIGVKRLSHAIQQSWPKWISYFPIHSPPITILETDWGLGGGSLGPFTLAIHLRHEYDQTSSEYLKSVLGWEPAPRGVDYIQREFAHFSDPLQAYVTDQVAHELGHIFFLHGITDLKVEEDIWFALGLGLVYDRLVWSELSQIPSPVFEAFERTWKENFANNSEIDQRLINPKTDNDEKFGLVRIQTYGHAKALAFLTEVRSQVGAVRFDTYVRNYLSRPLGSAIGYLDFLSYFSETDLQTVKRVEIQYQVR